jgi:hypothetical protein
MLCPPYFLINDGKGNFTKDFSRLPQELQQAQSPNRTNLYSGVALVDVNNDGFPDLILGSAYADVSKMYFNDGKGSFAIPARSFFLVGALTRSLREIRKCYPSPRRICVTPGNRT